MGLMQQGRKAMEPQTKWYAAISLFIVALCFVFYAGDWMQGVVHTKSAFYLWATTPPPCFCSSGGRYCRRVAMIVLLGWKGRARHKRHFQEKIIRAWIEGEVDNQMNSAVHLAFENFGLTLGVCLRNGLPALIQTHGVPVSERSWAVIWILQPKALKVSATFAGGGGSMQMALPNGRCGYTGTFWPLWGLSLSWVWLSEILSDDCDQFFYRYLLGMWERKKCSSLLSSKPLASHSAKATSVLYVFI